MPNDRSKDSFKVHRFIWKVAGMLPTKEFRTLYLIWSCIFNITIILFYPIHLIVGLFNIRTKGEIFKNLAVNFAVLSSSLKFTILWYHLKNIGRIDSILDNLDSRIRTIQEKLYFVEMSKTVKVILLVFGGLYYSASLSSELSTVIGSQRHLMYPAWLPIDWKASAGNYWIANMYQFIGLFLQISCNYASDTYPPVCIIMLSGHVRLLAFRLSKLGMDSTMSLSDNNKEFIQCIKDHQTLFELHQCMQTVLSKGMFFQIVITGINLCCTIIYLVFFADNFFATAYFALYGIALALEIFPCCYYGSAFEMELNDLPYAVFSSNWIEQDREFKKNILIFSERCFQPTSFSCMGLFGINLKSFYVTMKSAYSLFAVMLNVQS